MAEIIMPKVGDAMSEGKVVRWYKKAGDVVKRGEPLLEIETDKVNLDLEAEGDGTLGDDLVEPGTMVPVGEPVGSLLAQGEKAAPRKAKTAAPAPEADPQRRATDRKESVKHTTGEYAEAIETRGPRRDKSLPDSGAPAPASGQKGGRQRSSPLARRIARELGVPLESVQGSGPQGRVVAKDIQDFRSQPAAGGRTSSAPRLPMSLPSLEDKAVPLTAMRRTIAKRLSESTGPIPHFYLTADYDVTQLTALRQQLADIEGTKISLNDFIIRAVALALRHHPSVNASWGDDAIQFHGAVHVGVAVSTPEGLITPVIRDADGKSVAQTAQEVRALAEKAKSRKLMPNEYQGSTFTISNLGAWGIEEFTAIINPPNSAILAIGAAEAKPVVVERQIVVRDRMKVTLSCDHRVIDGAAGADFLKTLRSYVEQPLRLVI
jgi:pyruvate dehydrogenase E2 component (dihydrolipoamide acetyltransferase)